MTSIKPVQRLLTGLLVVALALVGAACGDDDEDETAGSQTQTTPTTAAAPTTTQAATTTTTAANRITIQNFTFMGIDNTRANTPWSITNSDTVPHTVSAVDGSFVWRVEPGQTTPFPRTLAAGSYPIRCDIHPSRMMGTLVVR